LQRADEYHRFRIHIWNCTHGGGYARPKDEYRIQIKSALHQEPSETKLLLGWHDGYGVFVGYDFSRHRHQRPEDSPSIQVKEQHLIEAHNAEFSVYRRTTKEIVVVFQPSLFCEYAVQSADLHAFVGNAKDLRLLERLAAQATKIPNEEFKQASSGTRASVLRTIKTRIREANFSHRVLSAYDRRCAVCNVQLKLVEAAHILPVAADGSTDETSNGIALCALHHRAFDNGLIYLEDDYRVVINEAQVASLKADGLGDGLAHFSSKLRPAIALPADRSLRPKLGFIQRGRQVRGI
jgi:putative restriction endonuclease